jgi:hypothetical protein
MQLPKTIFLDSSVFIDEITVGNLGCEKVKHGGGKTQFIIIQDSYSRILILHYEIINAQYDIVPNCI